MSHVLPFHVSQLLMCTTPLCAAVAWVRHEERLLFQKFPEVVFMDFTANSNQEKRPLYLMCFKLSTGESCVALRAILPSEQSWVCNFLTEKAMPKLLGKVAMARVVMGITDQCSNEATAWASARGLSVHFAFHLLCAWHKIYQGIFKLGLFKDFPDPYVSRPLFLTHVMNNVCCIHYMLQTFFVNAADINMQQIIHMQQMHAKSVCLHHTLLFCLLL